VARRTSNEEREARRLYEKQREEKAEARGATCRIRFKVRFEDGSTAEVDGYFTPKDAAAIYAKICKSA